MTPAAAVTTLLPTTGRDLLNGFVLGIALSVLALGVVGLLLVRQHAVFRIEVLHATPGTSQAASMSTLPWAGHTSHSDHARHPQPGSSQAGEVASQPNAVLPLEPLPSWEAGPEMLLATVETTFDQRRKDEEQQAREMEAAMLEQIFAKNLQLREGQVATA
jgi:hypothetical protein